VSIHRIPGVTAEAENLRLVSIGFRAITIKRDPVEPVPAGTLIARVFRVTGYDPDCDGSLMARLEAVDAEGTPTGWEEDRLGLHPDSTWVLDVPHELDRAAEIETEFGNRTRQFDRLCREHNDLAGQVIAGLATPEHEKITVAGLPQCSCGFPLGGGRASEEFITHALAVLAAERSSGTSTGTGPQAHPPAGRAAILRAVGLPEDRIARELGPWPDDTGEAPDD
jgi:hypothetical protein